jgi:Fe-S cluster assembly protein SufB
MSDAASPALPDTRLGAREYKYGITSPVENEALAKGFNEDNILALSKKKEEPEILLKIRIKA